MTNKKYQIFVSSTFRDLADERQDAIRNILDLKHIPAGMELFPAADVEQLDYIKRVIDECDYYLLIIGGRYGSVDEGGVSFTEREYDYAVDSGKVVIAFVHSDPATIPVGKSETTQDAIDALNAFREKVMHGRLVKMWNNQQDLEPLVLKALIHAFNDHPQQGWIRGDAAASDEILAQTNKALQENAELKEKLEELQRNSEPTIEGLADLDEVFEVRYRSKHHNYQGSLFYEDRKISASWSDIFISVAGCLKHPVTDVVIEQGIKALTKDVGAPEAEFLNQTDSVTIKAQLVALGLVRSYQANAVKGGVREFLALTDKGQRQFLEMRVVKSQSSN